MAIYATAVSLQCYRSLSAVGLGNVTLDWRLKVEDLFLWLTCLQQGQQASRLPDLAFDAQLWYVDPSYYNYSGCVCIEVSSSRYSLVMTLCIKAF